MLRYPPTRVADTTFLFDPPADTALSSAHPRNMVFESTAPIGPLAPFVAGFWFYRTDGASPVREQVLPTGTMGIVVDLGAGCGPLASGAQARAFAGQTPGRTTLVGVHFRPEGAAPFLGVPAGELHEAHVPLEDLWGSAADALHERLLAARSPANLFRALAAALLARVGALAGPNPAVAWALAELDAPSGSPPIAELARRTGRTARRFIQTFRDEVGLAPKLYGRVRRFQQAVGLASRDEPPDWAQIAADCGYYDQSHLVHEFKEFAGLTPTAYAELWRRHQAYACC